MSHISNVIGTGALALVLATPAFAQYPAQTADTTSMRTTDTTSMRFTDTTNTRYTDSAYSQYQYVNATSPNRGLFIAVDAGGLTPALDLNAAGAADFKTGFNAGGTVGVWLQRYIALRGNFTYGRNALNTGGLASGVDLNKYFYGGALQLQYPMASGMMPYAFVGGGGLTLDPSGSVASSRTTGAGLVGVGLNVPIPNSNFGVLGQASGLYYKLSDMGGPLAGIDHNQFDVTYSIGLSYRLPF